MRNICNVDTTKTTYELGYTNESRVGNEISLVIRVSNIESPYLEITLPSGDVVNTATLTIENEEINYTVPSSYYLTSGTLKFRVRGTDYNSDYITFSIPTLLKSTDDIIVKIDSSNFIVKRISNKNDYSTEEVKTSSTWIDGKPIYRKVTIFSSIINSSNNDLGIQNIDTIIESKVHVLSSKSQDDSWRKLPSLYVQNDSYGVAKWAGGYFIRKTGKIFFQNGTTLNDIQKCIVIIEYTKTTD